jgi:hypothetical protein
MVGTRDPEETTSHAASGDHGNHPFSPRRGEHPEVRSGTFGEAAAHGEMVVNATVGGVSLEALELAGEEDNLDGERSSWTSPIP